MKKIDELQVGDPVVIEFQGDFHLARVAIVNAYIIRTTDYDEYNTYELSRWNWSRRTGKDLWEDESEESARLRTDDEAFRRVRAKAAMGGSNHGK